MTTTDSGGFRFVSHQRRGLVALPGVAAAGTVDVSTVLLDGSTTTPVTLVLSKLGDVLGLDTTLVARQYPRPGATDVDTEFFPLVEFSTPETAWLLPTPDGPHGPIPWLCLVVVEDREGVSVTGSGLGKPDVLHIGGAAKASEELPDLAGCALWAHAYAATSVHTVDTADPTENPGGPGLSGCRLLAPRHLKPQTSYLACLVPTFAASALAGLGRSDQEIAAALAAPQPNYAWTASSTSVDLPTYLHWTFSCGDGGDFESLARALKEVPVGPTFGTRPLDLGLAGAAMPVTTTLATVFRGALTAPGIADQTAWPDPTLTDDGSADQHSVDTTLVAEIAAAAALTAAAASAAGGGGRPAVGPLLYARAAAARGDVNAADPATDWFDELNRDPRVRAVAGIATRVLRRDVEDVMARAWEQVGQVDEANAVLRRLQMSRAVTTSLHTRHLSGMSAGRLISAARPVLGRVALPAAVTGGVVTVDALSAVAASALPAGTTWRAMSAVLQPGTRLGDVAASAADGAEAASGSDAGGRYLATLVSGIGEPDILPDGTVGMAAPSTVFGSASTVLLTDPVRAAAAAAHIDVPVAGADPATLSAGLDRLVVSAGQLTSRAASGLAAETSAVVTSRALPPTVSFSQIGGVLVGEQTLRERSLTSSVAVAHLAVGQPATVLSTQTTAAVVASTQAAAAHPRLSAALITAAQQQHAALPVVTTPIGRVPISRLPITTTPIEKVPITTPITTPIESIPIQQVPIEKVPITPPASTIGLTTRTPIVVQLPAADPRLETMRTSYASAVDRFVRPGMATAAPTPGEFDLAAARTAVLTNLQPATTIHALATARVPAIAGFSRPDPVAPVMVGPVFTEAAYSALVAASHDAFVPGLDSIPEDSVTLVQTNPTFIAAYLAGLNSALGHELLWRGYPTDERGTYWHSFWGAEPDIGPLHQFHGSLPDNVTEGTQPLLVLILRGRLLRRYPDSDIYAVVASTAADVPDIDSSPITRPIFRDFVGPDITLVGFPLTYDQVVGTGGGAGYWFVIAEHPGQPRFGLTDQDPQSPHPPLPTWDELSWADLGPTAATATYVPLPAPPMTPAGTTRHWAGSAADMAAITYQPAVRVAIRAKSLLGSPTS